MNKFQLAPFYRLMQITVTCLMITGISPASPAAVQQQPAPAIPGTKLSPDAYVHYLLALQYASDNIRTQALHEAAASLRLQRQDNPSAALAFQLLTEQRQNVHLRLCCASAGVVIAHYSPDGSRILTVLDDNTLSIWDAHTAKRLAGPIQGEEILAAGWSEDSRTVVTSSRDSMIHQWDASTGNAAHPPFHTEAPLTKIALSVDGQRVLGSVSNNVYLFNASTGELVLPKIRYHDDVTSLIFSRDGHHALVGINDDNATLLDPVTGVRQHRLSLGNAVFSADFSRDSKFVLIGSQDHTAKIWSTDTGVAQKVTFSHAAAISDVVFSPDANRVLTTSYDHTARVWDAHTGQAITLPLEHSAPLIDGGFSADGSLIFTRGRDYSVRIWSAATGEAMFVPIHYANDRNGAEFSPVDPTLLLTVGNTVEILDMPPTDIAPSWLADLADAIAARARFSQITPPDPSQLEQIRSNLLTSTSNDAWTRFGKWYFLPLSQRSVSPWSQLSMQHYIEQLLDLNTTDSLAYARQIASDNPSWLMKIDAARKALKANDGASKK